MAKAKQNISQFAAYQARKRSRMRRFGPAGHCNMEDWDKDAEYVEYWLSRPPAERLAQVERLREMLHGETYATASRLSRSDLRVKRRRM